ncbi:MAG TPA: PQQ-binding-like beta-propeller repeat protein [Thermoleophilaceae bacterium]|nr:PQQ-binding-like beta-propeller repeat protein [Thermoleophilaceae bacterium]
MVPVRLRTGVLAVIATGALAVPSTSAADGVSVRVKTATQAQVLQTGKLLVRVAANHATRVRLSALVGKKAVAKRKTVKVKKGKARTAALKLNKRGQQSLAGCSAKRVTVLGRALGTPGLQARQSRRLGLKAPGGEWPHYSGTLDGHREQTAEKSITTDNVSELGVAWQMPTPDGGLIHSTPVLAAGCVFFGTELGNVYAVNADTGALVWKQALGEGREGSNSFQGAGIVGAPAVSGRTVYVGATTPKASVLSALDRATGKVIWKRVVDKDPGGGLDSSPVPFKGMVFQAFKGDESSDHSNPGFVIVDASRKRRGKILVKTHNIPAKDYEEGYRGSSTINTPAVDVKKMLVFAGTGNPASQKQHPISNSLIKIDADPDSKTFGKILASARGTSDSYPFPDDIESPVCQSEEQWPIGRFSCAQFDFNFLASPNLWTNSEGRQMFGGLQKSGVYTAVYTDTMEIAWQATVGVPCLACNLSSTAVDANGIYIAVTGGNLFSLNRDTGAVQWATPVTGTLRYNGVAVANGIVYSLNDAMGALQAFDAANGLPLFTHSFMDDTQTQMHDIGNSSGVSVARNMVFATAQSDNTSTLFALKRGATGDPGGGGGGGGGEEEPPPPDDGGGGGEPAAEGIIATGPGATNYGYLTPIVLVNQGGTASYTNADAVKHNVSSTEGLFRSELANTGETLQVEGVDKLEPGTYDFICEPHPGMKGQLIVQ